MLAELVKMGIPVYMQFGDNEPADYLIIVDDDVLRVQVKSSETFDGKSTVFYLTSSTIHTKNGVRRAYTEREVDLFLCCDVKNNNVFVVPNNGETQSFKIRYAFPKNNQKKSVNMWLDSILCVETLHKASELIRMKRKSGPQCESDVVK